MTKRWRNNFLLLFLFSLPACLIVAELGFRLFFCEPVGLFRPSTLLGYEMTPGYRGCHKKLSEFDTQIEINSKGLRDREYPPRSAVSRVLVLGDSVTFGFGVEAAESYPKQLELSSRAPSSPRPMEVINAGVWGYNTIQELAYVKAGAAGYEPDVIVVGLSLPLTVLRNWQSLQQGTITVEPLRDVNAGVLDRLRLACKQTSHLCSFLDRRWQYKRRLLPAFADLGRLLGKSTSQAEASSDAASASAGAQATPVDAGETRPDAVPSDIPVAEAVGYTVALLFDLREQAKERRADLLIVLLPTLYQLAESATGRGSPSTNAQVNRELVQLLRANDFRFVDLTDPLSRHANLVELYIPRDFTHLSWLGHRAAAEAIHSPLSALLTGALPEAAPE